MLNLFGVMVNHIISLPIDITESVAWTQRDIPVIGKFWNAISFGIPIYWKTVESNTNNLYPNINKGVPLFIGKANYEFYDKSYWPLLDDDRVEAKNKGNIPLDAFRYNTQDEVNDIIGASASNTSWSFTLTDKIQVSKWFKSQKTEIEKYAWISSVMIPQSFNDEDSIYLINEESVSLPTMETGKNLLTDIVGSGKYIIDAIGFYNLGKTACRIYMFSEDIDLFDPYSIMSYFVSLQTTSLYNNSVWDWLTIYSLSYLGQFIDDSIVHDWPAKLPSPQPSINFYEVPIILNKADSKLNAKSIWDGSANRTIPDTKTYSQDDILLFDFGIFGATEWKQVQDNYDEFEFGNDGFVRIWNNAQGTETNYVNKKLGIRNIIKIENITNSGYTIFNNLEEKNYPWGREEGYNFKTQIIFYNDGVKLKMRINYELWVKGGNYNISGYSANGIFLIETIPASNIRLKEK